MSRGISFSGLSSGIDSATIVEQLIAIERRPIVLLENQQVQEEIKLSVLQGINTSLLSVLNRADTLSDASGFDVFTVSSSDSDLVSATASGSASPGDFSVEVLSLAQTASRSSGSFSSSTEALGIAGEILVNGKAVSISNTDDLLTVRDAVNNADAGVQAQILQVTETDHRLLLTSEEQGAGGFGLQDASTTDLLQTLGFTGTATSIKSLVSGNGAQSDSFASSTTSVGSLMGLGAAPSGTVTIGNQTVTIDLATQSLTDIKNAITGVTTSLISEEVDGSTFFQLQIDGTTTFVDDNNVLEALGILKGTAQVSAAVAEVHTGTVSNTTDGSTPVDANTKFSDIFGAAVTNGDTITISGTTRDGTSASGSFTVSSVNSDRLQDLLDEIETTFGGVTASINSAGQVVVTDSVAGTSQLSVSLQPNNEAGGSLTFGSMSVSTEGQNALSRETAGQDAVLRVNGVTLTRTSNTVTDALAGVNLDLNKAEPGTTATVSVEQDTGAIRGSIESFVADYNNALSLVSQQFVFNEDTQSSGPLSGDSTLLTLQSQLRSVVTSPVSGLVQDEDSLSLFGVAFNRDGQLEIDSARLDDALNNNLDDLERVLVAKGSASDSNIEFVFQNDDTTAGTYDVSVTTAAEQASVQGTVDLSAGLLNPETISITDVVSNRSESIDLVVGEDTDDIVNKINSALSTSVAEVRTGSLSNTSDGATSISADNTFDTIFGANVAADDTIDIQGNLHNGERVSGTFTISDPATQTVNDLLAEVRSLMQGGVSASVDSSGRIVITDNQVGTSQITLALIERNEGGGNLNFGSIEVSTEGRFAIDVTASNEGGQLKLASDAYGSGAGFAVSQSSNETGITDDTFNGVDVVGTINGELATGVGRILTGDSGSGNVAGLSLRALLTPSELISQGSDQGTVKITQGVADQLRRTLNSITDPLSGLVATRQDAIQDTIDAAQDQIESMEDRLLITRQTLQRQFTAMETTLAEFNALGSFLGAQLASIGAATARN